MSPRKGQKMVYSPTKVQLAHQLLTLQKKHARLQAEFKELQRPEPEEEESTSDIELPEVPAEGVPFRPAKIQPAIQTLSNRQTLGPVDFAGRIIIHPTPYVRSLFAKSRRGLGGFQSLHQALQDRMAGSKELSLTPQDFARVINYAVNYGEGGFQQSLRWLVALWAAETLAPQLTLNK